MKGDFFMEEKRIAVLSVIVERREQAANEVNSLLSEYGDCIVGRMGIPYREKAVSVICVVLDAELSRINALTGKLGKIEAVTAKTLFSKY